jgi:hypothetical protein
MDGLTLNRVGDDMAYADGLPMANGDRAVPLYDAALPLAGIEVTDPILIAPEPTSTPGTTIRAKGDVGSGLTANVPPGAVERAVPAPGTVGASDPILLPATPTAGPTPQRRGTLAQLPGDTVPPSGVVSPVERTAAAVVRFMPTLFVVAGIVLGAWLLSTDRRK